MVELIRRDSWHAGLSVRALGKYEVHRRLVREALMHAEPAPRKVPEPRSPQLEPFKKLIDGWLRADLDDTCRAVLVLVHRISVLERNAIAPPGTRVITASKLGRLRVAIRAAASVRRGAHLDIHSPAWR